MLASLWKTFARAERGNIAITAAMAAPVLLMLAGGAVDVRHAEQRRAHMQEALDAAVIAGLAADLEGDEDAAQAVFAANKATDVPEGAFEIVSGDMEGEVSTEVPTSFLKIIGVDSIPISAFARARVGQDATTCLLLTEPTNTALTVNSRATLDADGCKVQVNSSHPSQAVSAGNSATISSQKLCVASGPSGVRDNQATINAPAVQCSALADPFDLVPEPSVPGTCEDKIASGAGTTITLPANRCWNNVTAQSGGKIVFEAGTHKITGAVQVGATGTIEGAGVTLFFSGANASLTGNSRATIDLSAATSGPHAGFVMFQSRTGGAGNAFIVNANVSGKIEGVSYIPRSQLSLNSNVALGATWSMIIAKTVILNADSTLTINNDYNSGPPLPRPLRPIYLKT